MSKPTPIGIALSAMMAAAGVQAEPLALALDQMDGTIAAGEADLEIEVEVKQVSGEDDFGQLQNDSLSAHETARANEIANLKQALEALQEQTRSLAGRIATLEAEGDGLEQVTEQERAQRKEGAQGQPEKVIEREQESLEPFANESEIATSPTTTEGEVERLEQRVRELEIAKGAQEDATRSIIQNSLSTLGSNINEFVALGGNLEVAAGWNEDFSGPSQSDIVLSSGQLDFEIGASDWVTGLLVFDFDDGSSSVVQNTDGSEIALDRVTLDTASVTIGDPLRFPPFAEVGQFVLPFGTGTGNPVADTLTVEDPLTIEVFETRQVAIGFGAGFPTPERHAATPPVFPPPVRPLLINPFIRAVSQRLGYEPPTTRPEPLIALSPTPDPPRFNAGIYTYSGDTFDGTDRGWRPDKHLNGTVGFRTKGHCGRPYDQLRAIDFCPWSIDVDIDFNGSVFDSRFLRSEYQSFLGQIGYVPGMAVSAKTTLGPVALVGEWNGAIGNANFVDDLGNSVRISPAAWQISLGYQFDWNPWVEEIGAQGTYATLSYSESDDLAGVTRLRGAEAVRVGFVPERRVLVGVGEWVTDSLRLAVEYSHNWDYSVKKGGTGNTASGVLGSLTYVW